MKTEKVRNKKILNKNGVDEEANCARGFVQYEEIANLYIEMDGIDFFPPNRCACLPGFVGARCEVGCPETRYGAGSVLPNGKIPKESPLISAAPNNANARMGPAVIH
jgi:hypothetical protein